MKASREEHYREAVEFVVENCLKTSLKHATKRRLRDALDEGGKAALMAQGELRAALHDYFSAKPQPARIDVNDVVVILDRSQEWVGDNKERLGYDSTRKQAERYDYQLVCEEARRDVSKVGMRCVVLVDGKEVVATVLTINVFAIRDDLEAGMRLRALPVEKVLSMRWRNEEDHRIWADAYLRIIANQLDQAVSQSGRR